MKIIRAVRIGLGIIVIAAVVTNAVSQPINDWIHPMWWIVGTVAGVWLLWPIFRFVDILS